MKTTEVNYLIIEVYSDLICPWCYIGKKRMEDGLKLLDPTVSYEIRWKAFELNPDMPPGGMDRKAYRSQKFGSWERSLGMDREVTANGADAGLQFNFSKINRTPNTFLGHRLNWFAHQQGKQNEITDALLRAYFSEGRDVGEAQTLVAVASENGLDVAKVAAFLASDEGTMEVREEERQARERGLTGVPFFIVNGVPAFAGAQVAEHFAETFRTVLETTGTCSGESCEITSERKAS
jgi:predicted DsbA family dithiol-disulfide isomerase